MFRTNNMSLVAVGRFARKLATAAAPKLQDVAIVGGGPAGLSTIAALKANPKTKHLSCTLIEANSLQTARDFGREAPKNLLSRNISLTPETVNFMRDIVGSWEHIRVDRTQRFASIMCYDSQDNEARAWFHAGPESGYIATLCEIVNIQSLLLKRLTALRVEPDSVMENTKVESITTPPVGSPCDWPIISLSNGEKIQARLVVGADGQNSPVRRYANIELKGWLYDRFGMVGVVKMQYEDPRSVAWQRFLSTGTLGLLPLPKGHMAIVWASPPKMSEMLMKVDERIMPHLVNAGMILGESELKEIYRALEAKPDDMGVIGDIQRRISRFSAEELKAKFPVPVTQIALDTRAKYPLKMAHVTQYTAPRVALVADAAHSMHPLAGQGFNMGEADVAALVRAIERGVEKDMDIGTAMVLESYGKERYPTNRTVAHVCDKIHKVFSSESYPVVVMRGLLLKGINMADRVKQTLKPSASYAQRQVD